MNAATTVAIEEGIWSRAIKPRSGDLPVAVAQGWLRVKLAPRDIRRAEALTRRAVSGELSPGEADQLAAYRRAGRLLELLQAKARRSIQRANAPA